MAFDRILATVMLDAIVAFDTIVAFDIPLVSQLTLSSVVWHKEEHFWNFILLQKVHLFCLVNFELWCGIITCFGATA
jgi:hypothetical protein